MITNYEHYKDEIMQTDKGIPIIDGVPYFNGCIGKNCENCMRHSGTSSCSDTKLIEWLMSEYEEHTDWSKVPVDTPIYVKMAKICDWVPRHFAKYERGIVYTWLDGATSFSTEKKTDFTPWMYAKLAKEDKND